MKHQAVQDDSITPRAIQYDLFGEIEAAEEARVSAAQYASSAAGRFLTETPWPGLIGWWLHSDEVERKLDRGEAKASFRRGPTGAPGWAWAIWRDGLRFEAGDTWQGWDQRPRWCIPWEQLHRVRDAHPWVTAKLRQLADGRGQPNSIGWRWWTDPFALHPDGWHSSYLSSKQTGMTAARGPRTHTSTDSKRGDSRLVLSSRPALWSNRRAAEGRRCTSAR